MGDLLPEVAEVAVQRCRAANCQVPGCTADLSILKAYFIRNKICEYHSKLSCMLIKGTKHRFCQQCGRFEDIKEFDGDKRTCFSKLDKHNARRRNSRRQRANAVLASYDVKPGACTTPPSSTSLLDSNPTVMIASDESNQNQQAAVNEDVDASHATAVAPHCGSTSDYNQPGVNSIRAASANPTGYAVPQESQQDPCFVPHYTGDGSRAAKPFNAANTPHTLPSQPLQASITASNHGASISWTKASHLVPTTASGRPSSPAEQSMDVCVGPATSQRPPHSAQQPCLLHGTSSPAGNHHRANSTKVHNSPAARPPQSAPPTINPWHRSSKSLQHPHHSHQQMPVDQHDTDQHVRENTCTPDSPPATGSSRSSCPGFSVDDLNSCGHDDVSFPSHLDNPTSSPSPQGPPKRAHLIRTKPPKSQHAQSLMAYTSARSGLSAAQHCPPQLPLCSQSITEASWDKGDANRQLAAGGARMPAWSRGSKACAYTSQYTPPHPWSYPISAASAAVQGLAVGSAIPYGAAPSFRYHPCSPEELAEGEYEFDCGEEIYIAVPTRVVDITLQGLQEDAPGAVGTVGMTLMQPPSNCVFVTW